MTRSMLAMLAWCCLLATSARADVPYWQFRSEGFRPFVRAIAVDPGDAGIVYVGVTNAGTPWGEYDNEEGRGVFRSSDAGVTWTERNDGIGSMLVTALVIDPTSTAVLYAGLDGEGVYKTTNSGGSWVASNDGLTDLDVYSLAIDPTTPTTLYAGTDGGGLFRSLDGGATWTHAQNSYGTVFSIAIHPSTPSTIYLGMGGGVAKSTDGGASVQATGTIGTSYGPEVRGLVVDANDPSTILAAGYGFDSGVWRSTDGGASWSASSTGLLSPFFDNNQHMTTLAQDPVTAGVFYASSTVGMFRSIDGGHSWAAFQTGLSRPNCPAVATHPDGTVYAGSVFLGDFHRLQVKPSGVNYYRCFKARDTARSFTPHALTVSDRFGTTSTTLLKPVRYCAPADPMGEGAVDPTAHLVCYQAPGGEMTQFIGFLSQRFDGYRGYSESKPETVCVPATVGVPAAAPRDAYRCVAGQAWSNYDTDFALTDDFGSQYIRRTRLARLCAPTDLDGGGGANRLEPDVDLRCDSLKGKTSFTPTTVTTTDRFGTLTLKLLKPDTHCFQALESRN